MKSKIITALTLAIGFFTTPGFAETTTKLFATTTVAQLALAPGQIIFTAHVPRVNELASDVALPALAAEPITSSTSEVSFADGTGARRNEVVPCAVDLDTNGDLPAAGLKNVGYSMPPSAAFYYDEIAPAVWYPSITFHLGFGRAHRG